MPKIRSTQITDVNATGVELNYTDGVTSAIQTQLDSKLSTSSAASTYQPLDSDLTTIAGLTATTDSFIQSKSSAWASRTVAQVKTDLGLSGTNSGDQTSIVGITGTKAQFDTAVTDGNILYVGDITQYTDELAQDAVGTILVDSAEIDFTYNDATPSITASLIAASIDESKLDTSVNASLDLADTALQPANISDTAYDATSWNGVTTIAPSKNAVRDKIDTMDTAIALNTAKVTNATHTGDVTGATTLTIDKTAITGKTLVTAVGTDYVLISDTSDTGNLKKALVSDFGGGVSDGDKGDITVSSSGTVWSIDAATIGLTELSATGTPSSSNYLRGDNTWATIAGGGDVTKVGTPVNNQVGVWTGDGTIEGDTNLTFDTTTDTLTSVNINATTFTGALVGNASTVTTNANLTGVVTSTGNATAIADAALSIAKTSGLQAALDAKGVGSVTSVTSANADATVATTTSTPVITIVSAPKLTTARTINGTSFDGTGNITVTADAGTLTGTTLNATVVSSSLTSVGTITSGTWQGTDIAVTDGGTGRATGTTAYALIATGTTATGVQQTLANGATTEILVGGGATALPIWTTATGSGSPVRATSPTLVTPLLGTPTSGTLTNCTGLPISGLVASTSTAIGVGSIELGDASDTTISRSAAGVIAVEGVVIPSISSTSTLSNKRITKRVGTTTSSATPTINTDNFDEYGLTAQTVDITSFTTNMTGTPSDGDTLIIRVTGTASRAITWGAKFAAGDVALPTTTSGTRTLIVGFKIINAVSTTVWQCMTSTNIG